MLQCVPQDDQGLQVEGQHEKESCRYANACAESFFHTLEVELTLGGIFLNRQSLREAVTAYIEVEQVAKSSTIAIDYVVPTNIKVWQTMTSKSLLRKECIAAG